MRDYSIKTAEAQLIYDAMVEDLKDKVKPDWVDLPAKVFKNPKNRLLVLKGVAGTGKDVGADFICAELGAPSIHQQWDAGIERHDVTATTGINPTPDAESLSPYKVIQGILNRCAERGYVAIVDEANMAVPGVTTLLNGFTDGSRYFNEYDRMVPIHPNFFIILTLNPGYRGTFPFNPSTLTRAALTIDVGSPGVDVEYSWLKNSPDDYESLHEFKSHDFPKKAWSIIYRVSQAFFDYAAKNTNNVDATYRQRKRIVDIILFDPFDVNNIKYAFLNGLFNSMGVNDDDMGKAKSFSDTPSNYESYKAIANILKDKFAPEPFAPEPVVKPIGSEPKHKEKLKEERKEVLHGVDELDDEVAEVLSEIMKDTRRRILDES